MARTIRQGRQRDGSHGDWDTFPPTVHEHRGHRSKQGIRRFGSVVKNDYLKDSDRRERNRVRRSADRVAELEAMQEL